MSKKLQEIGVVSFVRNDFAYLKAKGASACNTCSSKGSCGSGRLLNATESDYTIRVPNEFNLQQGDEVVIGLSSDKLLLGAMLIYLLPLLFLFAYAGIGKYFGGEIYSVLAGLAGLITGLGIAKKVISINKVARQFQPEVQEIY